MEILQKIKQHQNIIVAIIVILISLILITPIIQISQFNVPSADDYTYGQNTYTTWKNSHNIFLVIKAAGEQVLSKYNDWQGTFSAVFLFGFQPSIFGLQYYKLTPIILLLFFIVSNIFLLKSIAKKLFDYNKNSLVCIISFILIIFSLEFVPVPRESLFWWNGAIFYTFFYSIMLISAGILIRLITSTNTKHTTINTIISIILSIILGGGNYCTALQYVLIITLLTLILFIKKNNKKWNMLLITIVGILSLVISMVAPGNAIRQSNFTDRIGPIASIIESIKLSAQNCINWTTLPTIFMFLILILPIYQIIKESNYKFKFPIIFTILTFGIFAAQQVPTIYAINNPGAGRTLDIIYYSYYWLIISNIFYYLGWAKNKFGELKLLDYLYKNILPYTLILTLLLLGTLYLQKTYKNSLSYISYNSIKTGEAKQYYNEIVERYKILEDETITNAIVKPLSVKPSLLCGTDLQSDKNNPNYWVNYGAANYFNKNSVTVKK